jgi:hypothetical protein
MNRQYGAHFALKARKTAHGRAGVIFLLDSSGHQMKNDISLPPSCGANG